MSPLALTVLTADAASMCVLWVAWIYRPRYRPCARCGRRVKVGELECSHCGFDFHTIGA